jgi:hypothetical protein
MAERLTGTAAARREPDLSGNGRQSAAEPVDDGAEDPPYRELACFEAEDHDR